MRRTLPFFALFALASPGLASSQNFEAVQIRTQQVSSGVYMLLGQGGNIGVFVGEDGVFVIDDQYAPLTDKILAAIGAITSEPVRFVFNTHWHGDHTGGNENLGRTGALIVAHENVRERLSMDQVLERVGREPASAPAAPDGALPVITFAEDVTFHLNGDELHAFHVSNAHTDGDAIVHFRRANVVHMGDTFFRDRFPFIDTATGGSIDDQIDPRALAALPQNGAVVMGRGTKTVTVFSDFRCGYCKRLHETLETLNVKVVERPISVLGTRPISEAVICSPDKRRAVNQAYDGGSITTGSECDTSGLDANEAFARRHGFNGTPVIVREDGAVVHGYRPREFLESWIQGSAS